MSIEQNNVVRFISVTKTKSGIFANFKVKGMKDGASITSSIAVDIGQANVDVSDPMEKIIAECARIAVRMFEAKLQYEGLTAL